MQMGVALAINTDAHEKTAFSQRKYGIAVARRAGCSTRHVVNTMGLETFTNYLSTPKPERTNIYDSYILDTNS